MLIVSIMMCSLISAIGASAQEPSEPNPEMETASDLPMGESASPAAAVAEEVPAVAAAEAEGGEQTAEAATTNVAAILSSGDMRDPFWPIGYVPIVRPSKSDVGEKPIQAPSDVVPEEPNWEEASKTLLLGGTLKTGSDKYVAIVNEQVVQVNDQITAMYRGKTYRWKVSSITAEGVTFDRGDVSP